MFLSLIVNDSKSILLKVIGINRFLKIRERFENLFYYSYKSQ